MDKVLSARVDESVLQRIGSLARQLKTTKKQIIEGAITLYAEKIEKETKKDILDQSKKLKAQMKLNDWGYCLLLQKIGQGLYAGLQNKCNLFIWFMLTKSGYDSKVGYDKNEIYLLLPSKNVIYGVPYFTMDSTKYYAVTFDHVQKKAKEIYTYDGCYSDDQVHITLRIENSPVIRPAIEEKNITFRYDDKKYNVTLKLKRDVIDFYTTLILHNNCSLKSQI